MFVFLTLLHMHISHRTFLSVLNEKKKCRAFICPSVLPHANQRRMNEHPLSFLIVRLQTAYFLGRLPFTQLNISQRTNASCSLKAVENIEKWSKKVYLGGSTGGKGRLSLSIIYSSVVNACIISLYNVWLNHVEKGKKYKARVNSKAHARLFAC